MQSAITRKITEAATILAEDATIVVATVIIPSTSMNLTASLREAQEAVRSLGFNFTCNIKEKVVCAKADRLLVKFVNKKGNDVRPRISIVNAKKAG